MACGRLGLPLRTPPLPLWERGLGGEGRKGSRAEGKDGGFTLIELVMVIVVLGILAAVAIPKMTSLVNEAEVSAIRGVAGSLLSAGSINYAACATGHSDCQTVDSCNDVFDRLVDTVDTAQLKAKYRVKDDLAIARGSRVACLLELIADPSITAPFALTGTVAP
ncbi:MAG: prepilin-type N-terminal cleavage/methylation domain-containing protein [Magnetococcales bacterium]|nr:prepilin-type N-terminal cleavage/methylation domain-containing protein [Magnetococcales bacterium]